MFRVRPHRTTAAIGAALLATLALTACGGGGDSNDSSAASLASGSDGGSKGPNESADRAGAPLAGGDTGGKADGNASRPDSGAATQAVTPANLAASQEQLARRATIALQVKNIGQAVAKVRATTATAEGIVLSENIGTADSDAPLADSARVSATTYGEITISVPSAELDRVIAELGSVGKVIRSTSASENVGNQIVDTASRLETMRVSVERVRAFLKDAKDLNQIVAMEAELTRRQSDLESLEAQLASLKGSVARSPIQISLTTEPGAIVEEQPDEAGFLVGLKGGWDAFTGSATVLLTIVGALLPFLVVLALVGLPVWWFLRRRRTLTPPPTVLPE
jgi:hypothetical protein